MQESLKSLDEYRSKLSETEMEKRNMLREINIKDKQLKKLRTDLEFNNNNNTDNSFQKNVNENAEGMDDAVEFMKEEMLIMKSTYEKQIQQLKDEIDNLNRQMKRRLL